MARILAVDDEKIVREVLKRLLESEGHVVTTAQNGNTAFNLVQTQDFELVISDIRMSPLDGIQLLRMIRQSKPSLPVIILTAYATAETMNESQRLGVASFLTKPFTGEEVCAVVRRVLAAQQALPTVEVVVREYMSRSGQDNPYESKIELADELYWLEKDYPRERLLAAFNDALGKKNIPMGVIDEIIEFRNATVRVKQIIADYAKDKNVDAAKLLLDVSRKIATAQTANMGDIAKTTEYACSLLKLPPAGLTPADMQFFAEYFESWKSSRGRKRVPRPDTSPVIASPAETRVAKDELRLKQDSERKHFPL